MNPWRGLDTLHFLCEPYIYSYIRMATDEVAYILALKQIEILYIEDDRILSLAIP